MKSVWNGYISFGLVNIPVRMYSAVDSRSSSFRMLHKEKKSPIRYKRWCDDCTEEVAWQDIVKAVEVSKGKYHVLEGRELEELKPEATDRIEITEFVKSQQMHPIYFDSHYYLGPENVNDKAYFLFKEVLNESANVAIGTFVMREKRHVCAIESFQKGLLLTTMNYANEIRSIDNIEELKETPDLNKQEITLAKQLIQQMFQDTFKLEEYKDDYMLKLKELIKRKESGETITIDAKRYKATDSEKNLIEALKASLRSG
jgi:DNA end-binding protein Ku